MARARHRGRYWGVGFVVHTVSTASVTPSSQPLICLQLQVMRLITLPREKPAK